MIKSDKYYIENLNKIKNEGCWDENPRPKYVDGTPAHSKFITQIFEEYNLSENEFPIPTLRNTAIKMAIKEVLWIYQLKSNRLDDAHKLGINWWDSWDIGDGTIGQRYGATVQRHDLMNKLLYGLENEPFGRRHIIDLYQYTDLDETNGLYPCALKTTWSVRKINGLFYLDMTLDQRSSDFIVANFINKIQYFALQMMVANHLGYEVGKFCHFTQNLHIYDRHFEAVDELLERTPLETQPTIRLKEKKNFYEYTIDDFEITGIEDIQKIKSPLELAI